MSFPTFLDRIENTENAAHNNLEKMFGAVEQRIYTYEEGRLSEGETTDKKSGLVAAHIIGLVVLSVIALVAFVVLCVMRANLNAAITSGGRAAGEDSETLGGTKPAVDVEAEVDPKIVEAKKLAFMQNEVMPEHTHLKTEPVGNYGFVKVVTPLSKGDIVIVRRSSGDFELAKITSFLEHNIHGWYTAIKVQLKGGELTRRCTLQDIRVMSEAQQAQYTAFMKS